MINPKHSVIVVLHPGAINYFSYFLNSLVNQSFKKFEVLIFVDGIDRVEERFNQILSLINYRLIQLPKLTIPQNRFWIFNYLKENVAGVYHFCDADDTLNNNYFEVTLPFLNKYNIICHDFNLINEKGELTVQNFWSERLPDKFIFDYNFIKKYNIVGLGNTTINSMVLKSFEIVENDAVVIPDWYIFYSLLFKSKERAIFIKDGLLNYRQHNNLANINVHDSDSLQLKLHHVKKHYDSLIDCGFKSFNGYRTRLKHLKENLNSRLLITYLETSDQKNYFWWEEIEDLLNFYENSIIK